MGRKKLVEHFMNKDAQKADASKFTPQERFQNYLESRVLMIYNYTMKRWGVKPKGYLDAVQLSHVETNWGKHYILTVVFPHDLTNFGKQELGYIHYILGAFPTPDFVLLTVDRATHFDHEVDLITVEARLVTVMFLD